MKNRKIAKNNNPKVSNTIAALVCYIILLIPIMIVVIEKDISIPYEIIVIFFSSSIVVVPLCVWLDKKNKKETIQHNLRDHYSLTTNATIAQVDSMDGVAFEVFCAELLRKNGFTNVETTKGSGDQGVDILAEKDGIKYAIQCKCYSSDLGNKPIQEVFAGKSVYNCHVACVMTNRYFTPGGLEASKATGVLLWDRRKLQELIEIANKN